MEPWGDLALLAGVGPAADEGEEVLGELAGLNNGDLAVGAKSRLAPLSRGRAVRKPAPAGVILHMKPRTMVSRIS